MCVKVAYVNFNNKRRYVFDLQMNYTATTVRPHWRTINLIANNDVPATYGAHITNIRIASDNGICGNDIEIKTRCIFFFAGTLSFKCERCFVCAVASYTCLRQVCGFRIPNN